MEQDPDAELMRLARIGARKLVGNYGFTWADVDDIAGELVLDWILRRNRFDAKRSSRRTFQRRVVRNMLATIIRRRKTFARGYGIVIVPLEERYENLAPQHFKAGLSNENRSIDIRDAVARLPPDLMTIAVMLMSNSNSEVARQLGISRAALRRIIHRMRSLFEQFGLRASGRTSVATRKKSAAKTS